jgi:hypothetical protein
MFGRPCQLLFQRPARRWGNRSTNAPVRCTNKDSRPIAARRCEGVVCPRGRQNRQITPGAQAVAKKKSPQRQICASASGKECPSVYFDFARSRDGQPRSATSRGLVDHPAKDPRPLPTGLISRRGRSGSASDLRTPPPRARRRRPRRTPKAHSLVAAPRVSRPPWNFDTWATVHVS